MRVLHQERLRPDHEDIRPPSFLSELLFPLPASRRTVLGIVTWWESRRLVYNLIVGALGVVTLMVVSVAMLVAGQNPLRGAPWMPVIAYGVMANLCYTLGPIIEATLERVWKDRVLPIGPALFRQGLAFSIGLTLLPIPVVIALSMIRIVSHLFLR